MTDSAGKERRLRSSRRFEDDIKPLFRERDRDSMRFAFDLWSLDGTG